MGTGNAGNGGSLSSITRNPQGDGTARVLTLPSSHTVGHERRSHKRRVMTDTQAVNGTTNAAWTYGYDTAGRLTSASLAAAARPAAYAYSYPARVGAARTRRRAILGPVSRRSRSAPASPATTTTAPTTPPGSPQPPARTRSLGVTYNGHGDATAIGARQSPTTAPTGSPRSPRRAESPNPSPTPSTSTNQLVTRVATGTGTGSENSTTTYGYTGTGASADFQLETSNALAERYLSLPGGVLLTRRYTTSGGDVWSIPDLHGDIIATTGPTGTHHRQRRPLRPVRQPDRPDIRRTNLTATPTTRTNGLTDAWEGKNQVGLRTHRRPQRHADGRPPLPPRLGPIHLHRPGVRRQPQPLHLPRRPHQRIRPHRT